MLEAGGFIHSGYRLNFGRYSDARKSLLQWHNETFNIWSHLLGVVMFIFLTVYVLFAMPVSVSPLSCGNLDCSANEDYHIETPSFIHSYLNAKGTLHE
jgi:hypothetical protein